ncbi:MAG: phenylalanine--tRNA ligase beta subunit-related protein [Solirubrobacterales bacterium]
MTEQGWVAPAVASEFPGLGLASVAVDGPSGRSPASVRRRLNTLSDRFLGAHAVHMRERPIPWAYRVFFRQIGLDPDRSRTPVEALALERMKSGAFKSRNQLDDALTIAIIETGVALRAFDAARIEGELGIRDSAPGEELEGRPGPLPQGSLLVSDERRPLALLFGATAEGRGVHPSTERIVLVAIQVNGVPQIAIEEALWMAATVMSARE